MVPQTATQEAVSAGGFDIIVPTMLSKLSPYVIGVVIVLVLVAIAAVGGGVLTEENTAAIEELRLDSLPSGWEDLEKLPKLTRIVLPQEAVLKAEGLPDESVVLVLTGGDAS